MNAVPDPGDAAVASEQAELRQVEAALGRIDDGSHGVCSMCGRDLAAARRRANPAAECCILCQSAFERRYADPGAPALTRKMWEVGTQSTTDDQTEDRTEDETRGQSCSERVAAESAATAGGEQPAAGQLASGQSTEQAQAHQKDGQQPGIRAGDRNRRVDGPEHGPQVSINDRHIGGAEALEKTLSGWAGR